MKLDDYVKNLTYAIITAQDRAHGDIKLYISTRLGFTIYPEAPLPLGRTKLRDPDGVYCCISYEGTINALEFRCTGVISL